eukprot:symbB.v1.2.006500.t1/scaffold361.1/size299464/23
MVRTRSSSLPPLRQPLIEEPEPEVSSDFIKAEVVIKTLPIYHSIATPEGSRRESVVHPQLSDGEDEELGLHVANDTDIVIPPIEEENRGKSRRPRRKKRSPLPCLEGNWTVRDWCTGSCCQARCCDKRCWELKGQHVHCFQVCCARLTCSWCLKMILLVVVVNYIFLSGPLSQPLWIPISTKYACEANDDGTGPAIVQRVGHKANVTGGLHACESLCNEYSGCQAIDWYNTTRWCNLYAAPCLRPTASWDGASSYQKAVVCQLYNGTSGVLIGGHCHVGIHVPSMSSVVEQELPAMLLSPKSWGMTLIVALVYTYVMSAWCRQKLSPVVTTVSSVVMAPIRWTYRGGIARKVGMSLFLLAAWVAWTVHLFGLPPSSTAPRIRKGELPEFSYDEWGWIGVSFLLFLLLICKGFRMCLLSVIVSVGTCIMSAFASACTWATSLCLESSLLADAAVLGGAGAATATVEGAAGAAATAEVGATAEAAVAADAALGVEGSAAADVAAGGAAAGEAATAAEAAATAEAVVAADAVVAAEGLGVLALCAIQ